MALILDDTVEIVTETTTAKPIAENSSEASLSVRCRTNSRRGLTDPTNLSYPPVKAVTRAFDVLRAVNQIRIASVNDVFEETGIPKSTIVRMLETLMAQGYVVRDNMCGGYRVTSRVQELTTGYDDVSRVIEVARPFAIEFTQRVKWPIGLGVEDGDAMAIQFWTGTISPLAHTNTVLGLRPEFYHSAMGRIHMAFCGDEERERRILDLHNDPDVRFGDAEERSFRGLLEQAKQDGYAIRDPRTAIQRTTTLAMPVLENGTIHAVVTVSFFRTAMRPNEIHEKVIDPLRVTVGMIESALSFMNNGEIQGAVKTEEIELGF